MVEINTLSRDDLRRLLALARRMEADERAEAAGSPARRPPDPVQLLKITGAAVSGEYPAALSWYNAATATETLSDPVAFRPAGTSTPAVNDYVTGRFTGASADGTKGLYRVVPGGAGPPTVAIFLGTPAVENGVWVRGVSDLFGTSPARQMLPGTYFAQAQMTWGLNTANWASTTIDAALVLLDGVTGDVTRVSRPLKILDTTPATPFGQRHFVMTTYKFTVPATAGGGSGLTLWPAFRKTTGGTGMTADSDGGYRLYQLWAMPIA